MKNAYHFTIKYYYTISMSRYQDIIQNIICWKSNYEL